MRGTSALALVVVLLVAGAAPIATAQQPDFTQEHWYHSYATLTIDVQAW
jgi:opacity protein-like surface antigen